MRAVPGMTLYVKKCRYANAVIIDRSWFTFLLEKGWNSKELHIGEVYVEDENDNNFILTKEQFGNLFEIDEVA
jgi:hypothetical protein